MKPYRQFYLNLLASLQALRIVFDYESTDRLNCKEVK